MARDGGCRYGRYKACAKLDLEDKVSAERHPECAHSSYLLTKHETRMDPYNANTFSM